MRPEIEEALASFSALVDEKVGLIRAVELVRLNDGDPAVFLAHALPGDTRALRANKAANVGAACATSLGRAVLRACGESIERYCSAFWDPENLIHASSRQLASQRRRHVLPSELYPFSQAQYRQSSFPFRKVSPTQPIVWVLGETLDGNQALIPASCVYVPYVFDPAKEPFTHMPISTGLAAERCRSACIEKGICEILERDALMIAWLNQWPAPRISVESCLGMSAETDELLDAGTATGSQWHLSYLTLDVDVPIIASMLISEAGLPLTSFGISADPNPLSALRGALEEALLTRLLINRSSLKPAAPSDLDPSSVRSLRDHLMVHASSEFLREHLRFMTESGEIRDFADIASGASMAPASACCREQGLEPIWAEVTTPDVADLGFYVVRTVIPSAQPLDNDHLHRHLGGRRLHEVPERLGWAIRPVEQLNPHPHPFP